MLNDRPRFITTPSRGRNEYPLQKIKSEIRERSNYTCDYCGGDGRQVEHINPVSDAGINDPRNLITACEDCNQRKGSRPVTEFLEEHPSIDIGVADLPIYGDLIVYTPTLPAPYQRVREETIIKFRQEGGFSGADALKTFERRFRRNLWQTDFGYRLCLQYPSRPAVGDGVPGHRRVVVPLLRRLAVDTRSPVYAFLYELTKNATLRQLIDDMVYYQFHERESIPDAITRTIDSLDNSLQNEVLAIKNSYGIDSFREAVFQIPLDVRQTPVQPRDLLCLDINDFCAAGGSLYGIGDGYKIKLHDGSPGSDVPVRITAVNAEFAQAIPIELENSPAIAHDEARIRKVINEYW